VHTLALPVLSDAGASTGSTSPSTSPWTRSWTISSSTSSTSIHSLSFVQLRPFHSKAHSPPYTISYRNCVFNYFCFIEILCAFDREFFSPLWLQLLVKFIKAGGGPVCEETSFSLTAQLQAIDLLRVLLPEWTGTVYQQK
jgi:hypothetical protein